MLHTFHNPIQIVLTVNSSLSKHNQGRPVSSTKQQEEAMVSRGPSVRGSEDPIRPQEDHSLALAKATYVDFI